MRSSSFTRPELDENAARRALEIGATKINMGGVLCTESGEAAVGAVAGDHFGTILAAASRIIGRCQDAEEAEAAAILEGFRLAINHNLTPATIESECATVVRCVNMASVNRSKSWTVYRDISDSATLSPTCKKW